ncbi:unnamed protein product [Amoebophrya sp. A25]|nr:unnamed protein product [Amoebophrya sp. A25]|eukprot:GSA25T00001772001.1
MNDVLPDGFLHIYEPPPAPQPGIMDSLVTAQQGNTFYAAPSRVPEVPPGTVPESHNDYHFSMQNCEIDPDFVLRRPIPEPVISKEKKKTIFWGKPADEEDKAKPRGSASGSSATDKSNIAEVKKTKATLKQVGKGVGKGKTTTSKFSSQKIDGGLKGRTEIASFSSSFSSSGEHDIGERIPEEREIGAFLETLRPRMFLEMDMEPPGFSKTAARSRQHWRRTNMQSYLHNLLLLVQKFLFFYRKRGNNDRGGSITSAKVNKRPKVFRILLQQQGKFDTSGWLHQMGLVSQAFPEAAYTIAQALRSLPPQRYLSLQRYWPPQRRFELLDPTGQAQCAYVFLRRPLQWLPETVLGDVYALRTALDAKIRAISKQEERGDWSPEISVSWRHDIAADIADSLRIAALVEDQLRQMVAQQHALAVSGNKAAALGGGLSDFSISSSLTSAILEQIAASSRGKDSDDALGRNHDTAHESARKNLSSAEEDSTTDSSSNPIKSFSALQLLKDGDALSWMLSRVSTGFAAFTWCVRERRIVDQNCVQLISLRKLAMAIADATRRAGLTCARLNLHFGNELDSGNSVEADSTLHQVLYASGGTALFEQALEVFANFPLDIFDKTTDIPVKEQSVRGERSSRHFQEEVRFHVFQKSTHSFQKNEEGFFHMWLAGRSPLLITEVGTHFTSLVVEQRWRGVVMPDAAGRFRDNLPMKESRGRSQEPPPTQAFVSGAPELVTGDIAILRANHSDIVTLYCGIGSPCVEACASMFRAMCLTEAVDAVRPLPGNPG